MSEEEREENPNKEASERTKRDVEADLDRFETRLAELRISYEQHFSGILPMKPEKHHEEVQKMLRNLLRAPFHNSATRFRLRMLSQRYQTFNTYWERVLKQKETGTYRRDVNMARKREEVRRADKQENPADKRLKQLYASYEEAVRRAGAQQDQLNFDAFKKTVAKTAKDFKDNHGTQKMSYKIVMKDGKVVVKASSKDQPKD